MFLAQHLSIKDVSLHDGFISPAIESETYKKLIHRIRRVADLLGDLLQGTPLLDAGQESADQLLAFLDVAGRDNIAINFGPANMILYNNNGDMIDVLAMLMPKVRQVHIKDALYPVAAGLWGKEVPVGQDEMDCQIYEFGLREQLRRGIHHRV